MHHALIIAAYLAALALILRWCWCASPRREQGPAIKRADLGDDLRDWG